MHGINRLNNLNVNENLVQRSNLNSGSNIPERSIFDFSDKSENDNFFINAEDFNIDDDENAERKEFLNNIEDIIELYNNYGNDNNGNNQEDITFGLYHSSGMLSMYNEKNENKQNSINADDLSSLLKYIDL